MNHVSPLVVIPARYASSRLPGKPLVEICGVPMILRTYQQCLKAVSRDNIIIATDDNRIRRTCETAGAKVVMTSPDCLTGTDRVAEVACKIDVHTYINVQGDEPLFDPADLQSLIEAAQRFPNDVINGYCQLEDTSQYRNTSIPKVVMRPDARLLYMSRAPIPGTKNQQLTRAWRQVCAYAFPRDSLRAFAACSGKTELESIEDIEILRFLELGFDVRMVPMSNSSIAVDLPADVERAESAIAKLPE